ncbi:glycoside hydrolase [bacterium]|nr:glycoside hydrolase [bacterium]
MRKFFRITSIAAVCIAAAAVILPGFTATAGAQQPDAEILSTAVVCKEPGRYIGWPSVARTKNGDLVAVFSGDRDEHVCPWGKTEMVRSADGGETWSAPVTVNNTPLDDRDAGVIVTAKGTILVSWFTSLAFDDSAYKKHYPASVIESWKRHAEKLSPEIRKQWLGCWVRRSEDGGATWGDPIRVAVNSPHGPIQLRDGRILYVGKTLWAKPEALDVIESRDDGVSWTKIGTIPLPPGGSIDHCHELHAVENGDGTILAMIRYQPQNRDDWIMRQSVSKDGGRTWSTPESTGIWGLPPHLIQLRDGRLVVVYGYRKEPFGERACISRDGGKTWDIDHIIELTGAPNGDLGYPASTELGDGSIFTVYYQIDRAGEKTCLMGTHWRAR